MSADPSTRSLSRWFRGPAERVTGRGPGGCADTGTAAGGPATVAGPGPVARRTSRWNPPNCSYSHHSSGTVSPLRQAMRRRIESEQGPDGSEVAPEGGPAVFNFLTVE